MRPTTNENFFGPIIHTYTREQAVADGVLEHLGHLGDVPVYATAGCSHHLGLSDMPTLLQVLSQVRQALALEDPEDDDYRMLRVLERQGFRFWAILEPDVLTLLRPEDY